MILILRGLTKMTWGIKQEENYIKHAIKNHGKVANGAQNKTDARAILQTWLKTYRERGWYIPEIVSMKPWVQTLLNDLE